MTSSYRVAWTSDVEADTPREAALQARASQTRDGTAAVVFEVQGDGGESVTVDLNEPEHKPERPFTPPCQLRVRRSMVVREVCIYTIDVPADFDPELIATGYPDSAFDDLVCSSDPDHVDYESIDDDEMTIEQIERLS